MGLITRGIGPNPKGTTLTYDDMDNNLLFLDGKTSGSVDYFMIYDSTRGTKESILKQQDDKLLLSGSMDVDGGIKYLNIFNSIGSITYDVSLDDGGKLIEMTSSSPNTVILPDNATVNIPVGFETSVVQNGNGQTQILGGSPGVVILSDSSFKKLRDRYVPVTIVKRAVNEWYIFGSLKS